jgi:hypothetical protein
MISTGEQDGWAYVATGSETYAQWERHRQRQVTYLRELEKRAPVTRALAELRRTCD